MLLPLFAQHTQQLRVMEWPNEIAGQFAEEQATHSDLHAENLADVLDSIVHHAHGSPGAIAAMVKMACLPRYRLARAVKTNVLYLDFRMGQFPLE